MRKFAENMPERELADRMRIIQSLSEIYTAVYYIDLAEDRYVELASVSNVRPYIGTTGRAQEKLNFFCRHMMLPAYTEEMLAFVDLSTLDERLSHERIVSKQYQSTVILSPEQGERPD